MSRVYFHGRQTESELCGSERAYAGVLCSDIGLQVLDLNPYGPDGDPSPIKRLVVNARYEPPKKWDHTWMRIFLLGGFSELRLKFDGEEYDTFDLVLNTVIATGSPYLAFLARMHGTCEIHGWVDEPNREWLADIFEDGRARNIFRADQGWEGVITHLRNGDGGPVVMSYSVCDQFPEMPENWDGDEDAWYELPGDQQWDLAMAELQSESKAYLEITPDNLTTQMFMTKKTLWDAVASPEYRQWYLDRNAESARRVSALSDPRA